MLFRVGHDVRYEINIDAASAKEAERLVDSIPYSGWTFRYSTNEDVLAIEEDPRNPNPAS